jgi:hypothetical protein
VGSCLEIDEVWIRVRRSSRRGVEEVMLVKDLADEDPEAAAK